MAGKLIMTKGLPASGKSTWASEQLKHDEFRRDAGAHTLVVVTKDDIRNELFKKDWNFDKEKEVLRIRDFRISEALSKGLTVISADTNLAPKHETRLREIAKKYKAVFEIKDDFLDVPLHVCIERDKGRDDSVGEKVIKEMAEQFLVPSSLIVRTGEPQLFVDLDGVLADFDGFIEEHMGITNNRENEDPDFWPKVRAYQGRMFLEMSPLKWAASLWKKLKPFKPIILTGNPWSIPTAADDKRQWVKEKIDPDVQVICCKSRNKRLYGRAGDILLDDWTKYEPLWTGMGGKFIHFTGNVEESVKAVKEALAHG